MDPNLSVVLGGSRHLQFIPDQVESKVVDYVSSHATFYVGDAIGSDYAFQALLVKKKYRNVVVFSSANYVRHNLGKWPSEIIVPTIKSKSANSHAFKDRFMTKKASVGIMIWDGKSAGTLSNVLDLLELGKECYLYFAVENEFSLVDNMASLLKQVEKYPETLAEAQKRLKMYRKREAKSTVKELETLF